MHAAPAPVGVGDLFEAHRGFLWGLLYRLTGSAADAEDLVQETFVRAMERPPARTDEPWRPWLARVAMNLGRDQLRRRLRRRYLGPWLPEPVETPEDGPSPLDLVADDEIGAEGRYGLAESVTCAFLVALEALTPQRRAVLLLRDVFDYSVRETAGVLDLSEGNVKTTLHRARADMVAYDRARLIPTPQLVERTRRVVEQFVMAVGARDAEALERLIADDARCVNDGGLKYVAARRPVIGPVNIRKLILGLTEHADPDMAIALRAINGLPALVVDLPNATGKIAPRYVMQFVVAEDGRLRAAYSVLAQSKLGAVG